MKRRDPHEVTNLCITELAAILVISASAQRPEGEKSMANKDKKCKPYRIYLKHSREWVEVPEEVYYEHTRYYDAFRKRQQYHGQCACPKNKFWLCDGDCYNCEFRRAGDMLSLDHETENGDGDTCSLMDLLQVNSPSIEDIVCDRMELQQLLERLEEIMPEALIIGQCRQEGRTDEEIAIVIGIKRTTFRSRLRKAKEQISKEFPDCFHS